MKAYSVHIPSFQLLVPSEKFESEYELKEYALRQCRTELLKRLTVEPWGTDEDDSTEILRITKENAQRLSHQAPLSSKKLQLLSSMANVQRQFFHSESPKIIFGVMLDALLDLMDSEYGFIGETKHDEDGTIYLQTHAVTNIAWDQATRQFYEDNVDQGFKFYNMDTLFGVVIKSKQAVIANDPKTDPRAGGVPQGHPPLNRFLGIPLFLPGGELNGMVGISNKPGGYTQEDIDFLEVRRAFIVVA
jgi:GAF domain